MNQPASTAKIKNDLGRSVLARAHQNAELRHELRVLLNHVFSARYQAYISTRIYIMSTFTEEFTDNITKMVQIAQDPHVLPRDAYKFGAPY